MVRFRMEIRDYPDSDGHRYKFDLPFEERLDNDLCAEVVRWCTEEFGVQPNIHAQSLRGARWCGHDTFWFRDEADALHFKLRWC